MNFDSLNKPPVCDWLKHKLWTVSDKNKRPIDIRLLFDENLIKGASSFDEQCLTSAFEIKEKIPNTTNMAYHFDSMRTSHILIDIEPIAPQAVKDYFLACGPVYAETSLSGKGLHLIFPFNAELFAKFGDVANISILKHKKQYYDLMLYHFVTFTGNLIEIPEKTKDITKPLTALFTSKKRQKEVKAIEDFKIDKLSNIPDSSFIISTILTTIYPKNKSDFANDTSRWETGVGGFYYNKIMSLIKTSKIKKNGHEYSRAEITTILYHVLTQILPQRKKHGSVRDNMPYLAYLAKYIVERN